MFLVRYTSGIELTENQVKFWDNLGNNHDIERLGVMIPRKGGGAAFVFDFQGYESYCVAKVGHGVPGISHPNQSGYSVYLGSGNDVTRMDIMATGIFVKHFTRETCELPERCWRRGVPSGL
jgi:hypothetical protein